LIFAGIPEPVRIFLWEQTIEFRLGVHRESAEIRM
jgi:hypothetical protein